MSRRRLLSALVVAAALSGCAATPPPIKQEKSYLDRAEVRVKQAVSVTASVLDDQEASSSWARASIWSASSRCG
jgi:starvation-inducible outer membrane lipoprotein